MDTTPRNENALREQGEVVTAKQSKTKPITKLDRIVNLLKTRPEGLNARAQIHIRLRIDRYIHSRIFAPWTPRVKSYRLLASNSGSPIPTLLLVSKAASQQSGD